MSAHSPLVSPVLFHLGPVPVAAQVVTTWGIMLVLAAASWASTRRLRTRPGPWQSVLEAVVETVTAQVAEVIRRDAIPFLPLLGTLFLFIAASSLAALLPGVRSPTASAETPAALALIVFLAVHVYGIRARGIGRYLKGYLQPNPLLLPLNVLAELTRTFSLMVRLMGNMMSHEIVLAVVVTLAGFLVPVPFMVLGVLIGLIQAYIFTVLATVFIGAAIGATDKG